MAPAKNPLELSALAKSLARECGFDLAGVRAQPSARAGEYRAWLAAGRHGAMDYLARNVEERLDITRKFPWARSVLCVGLSYFHDDPGPASEGTGRIARYAWGRDYHKVVEGKFRRLERSLRAALGPEQEDLQIRYYCDTGPILERELAARAGLGWIGKHTLLIAPGQGSWFVLGEMVLSLELAPDSPVADHCGTCRRCIEACPTAAITPYSVEATRCISYLTLEQREAIAPEFHGPLRQAGYIVGCDLCQEVCPHNGRPLLASDAEASPRPPAPAISLPVVRQWTAAEWDAVTRGRAFRRAKLEMWQRSAEILSQPRVAQGPAIRPIGGPLKWPLRAGPATS